MPAGASAPPIWARVCCRPMIAHEAAAIARQLDAYNGERKKIEENVLVDGDRPGGSRGGTRSRAGEFARLACRRDRHCRQPPEGALWPAGLRGGGGRRHRQGLGPLGTRHRSRQCGDRRAPGGAVDQWRRPCHGGGIYRGRGQARGAARFPGRAAGQGLQRRAPAAHPRSRCGIAARRRDLGSAAR